MAQAQSAAAAAASSGAKVSATRDMHYHASTGLLYGAATTLPRCDHDALWTNGPFDRRGHRGDPRMEWEHQICHITCRYPIRVVWTRLPATNSPC